MRKSSAPITTPAKDEFHYLPVTPHDRLWGLWITAAGTQCVPSGCRFQPAGHSPSHDYLWRRGRVLHEFALVYVVRGRGEFESKSTGLLTVEAGDAILLSPDLWHRYRHVEQVGWDTLWCTFQGDWPDQWRRHGVLPSDAPLLHPGLDEAILHSFTALLDRVRGQPLGLQPLLAADAMSVLAGVFSAVQRRATGDRADEVIRRAKAMIEAADRPPVVAELAEALGLGRSRFHQLFQNCIGLSPYQYHLQLRMSRAKELLRGSALSVKQIAAALRFSSVYQFSRMFRKKTGQSPSRYRRGG